ncbi:heptaprenyl diphosphate synthase component 1 [Neobacillus rhizosphaerae]|uniref:heptaprenyl diphosphate synthase component 1 n=1 Tax=Neobacillus rhizosphaerae TaxID=2880965 RepID=UPI003D28B5D5
MIILQDIRQKFTNIREQVEKKVLDAYLLEYIEAPIIDEDKLLILISIMDRIELSYSKMQNYAMSTMLIQIALDTHEHISNSSKDEKSRQLTVLAGDYFSGLYYKLLADSDDITLIKALSEGIKQVNEQKISVYQKESDGIEKLMISIKLIESALLLKLSEVFKIELWNDFLSHLFLFKRLLKEKNQFIQTKSSVLFDALKKIVFPINDYRLKEISGEQHNHLLMICDQYIERSRQIIEKGLNQLPYLNDVLESRISTLLKQYKPYAKSFVEEG